jgi:geranylgeranyl diphosphate synthase type I
MAVKSKEWIAELLTAIEEELKAQVYRLPAGEMRDMLTYHMGWTGEGSGPEAQGKRIRPLLTVLTCTGTGGNWHHALPAAAAVELVHNFSLIHDDIEDYSDLRRGRKTVWKEWGMPQAVNAGDLMFTLSRISILDLSQFIPAERVLKAVSCLDRACESLKYGQFLDLDYETRKHIGVDDYWKMISGKTAALTSCSTKMGGLVSGAEQCVLAGLAGYGQHLGLAFQVVDDWLGIWGDATKIGKSTESDLVSGKKTLPVLFGLEKSGEFAEIWQQGVGVPDASQALAGMLESLGAQEYTLQQAEIHTQKALHMLEKAVSDPETLQILKDLTLDLLTRNK